MNESIKAVDTKEQERDRNALDVKGERYHIVAGARQGKRTETRSGGYGDMYEYTRRVGYLNGSITLIEQQTGQPTMFQIVGVEWGETSSDSSYDLLNLLHAIDIPDEAIYADALGEKLREVAACAQQIRRGGYSSDPAYRQGQLTYLNLDVFSRGLKDYLREVGALPEAGGQMRINTTKAS